MEVAAGTRIATELRIMAVHKHSQHEERQTIGAKGCERVEFAIAGFLRRMRAMLPSAGSIGYVRKKKISSAQRKLHGLKAQVDELSQRVRSIETLTTAVVIELSGPGPFRLPMLTRFKSLFIETDDQLVAEFELQDGKSVYAIFPYLTAAQVVNGDVSLPLQKVTLNSSTSIDIGKPSGAFRLPDLSGYEGHFYAGRDARVLVFFTQHDGLRVFFPVSLQTYNNLLREFEAALVAHRRSNVRQVGLVGRVPYPMRSGN